VIVGFVSQTARWCDQTHGAISQPPHPGADGRQVQRPPRADPGDQPGPRS